MDEPSLHKNRTAVIRNIIYFTGRTFRKLRRIIRRINMSLFSYHRPNRTPFLRTGKRIGVPQRQRHFAVPSVFLFTCGNGTKRIFAVVLAAKKNNDLLVYPGKIGG